MDALNSPPRIPWKSVDFGLPPSSCFCAAPFRCNPSSLWWANRKSGAPGVLSPPTKTNLGWRFLGNQKLHTKMGIKMKEISGLIDTWYLLRFGSNVMKMCSFEIPPKQDLLGDCGDWGVGCPNNGKLPKDGHRIIEQWHSPKSDLSTSRSALKRIHPDRSLRKNCQI